MENNQFEAAALKQAVEVANRTDVTELTDLELSLIGGGSGEITPI